MKRSKLTLLCFILFFFVAVPVGAQQTTLLTGDFPFSSLALQSASLSGETLSIVIVGDILTPLTDAELEVALTTNLDRPRQVSAAGTMVLADLPGTPALQIEHAQFDLDQLNRDDRLLAGTVAFYGPVRLTGSGATSGGPIVGQARVSFPVTVGWAGGTVSLIAYGDMSIDLVLLCMTEAICAY